jgi:hypothetical protein
MFVVMVGPLIVKLLEVLGVPPSGLLLQPIMPIAATTKVIPVRIVSSFLCAMEIRLDAGAMLQTAIIVPVSKGVLPT